MSLCVKKMTKKRVNGLSKRGGNITWWNISTWLTFGRNLLFLSWIINCLLDGHQVSSMHLTMFLFYFYYDRGANSSVRLLQIVVALSVLNKVVDSTASTQDWNLLSDQILHKISNKNVFSLLFIYLKWQVWPLKIRLKHNISPQPGQFFTMSPSGGCARSPQSQWVTVWPLEAEINNSLNLTQFYNIQHCNWNICVCIHSTWQFRSGQTTSHKRWVHCDFLRKELHLNV